MSATTEQTPAALPAPAARETQEGPDLRPWQTREDRAGHHAAARGSGKRRPLAVSLMLDLDAAQSEWLRREAQRCGRDYDDIIKALLDRERTARP